MTRCLTFTGRHRFEPRYDTEPPEDVPWDAAPGTSLPGPAVGALIQLYTKKTYRGDVCRYCGERSNEGNGS